ncbi:MAG TPA: heparan-alpha-glucosaminide N-acetyltransferase domain-containing protein [Kofleriaceae bacterium]|nr:heparan-alpha-glucosaminide N-acetyltransferase domain-containing protein [Kofleriaceae bacterium]
MASVDVLRGAVMIVMALDHVRDYVSGAMFDPVDVEHTTLAYFFTRWITHFCAPTFCFLAGVAAFFASRRRTPRDLSVFLVTRGLWLVFVEFTLVRFAWSFDIGSRIRLLVIWVLGISMIVLAGLVRLPRWLIAAISLVMIAGHNLLDRIDAAPLISRGGVSLHAPVSDWIWSMLHVSHYPVLYPLIPWVGVMAAGYAFGPWLLGEPVARDRRLVSIGLGITLGFVALRAANWYGDPTPWTWPHAVLSFLDTEKYPPSLLFLMMTLGPAILSLPLLERVAPTRFGRAIAVFGRVPFFYYIVHIYLIHGVAIVLALIVTGALETNVFDLWVVYAVWIAVIAALYPLCRWFAGVKARRRDAWLSYL